MQNIHRTNINSHTPSSRREEVMKGHKNTLAGKNNLMRNGWDPCGPRGSGTRNVAAGTSRLNYNKMTWDKIYSSMQLYLLL